MDYIYKASGSYLGFISNGFLYSRDGVYLGWLEGQHVWDSEGRYRGQYWNEKYVISNRFGVLPVPRPPRAVPGAPALPNPPPNIAPITLPTGWVDAF
jgi:hypothetical protein